MVTSKDLFCTDVAKIYTRFLLGKPPIYWRISRFDKQKDGVKICRRCAAKVFRGDHMPQNKIRRCTCCTARILFKGRRKIS